MWYTAGWRRDILNAYFVDAARATPACAGHSTGAEHPQGDDGGENDETEPHGDHPQELKVDQRIGRFRFARGDRRAADGGPCRSRAPVRNRRGRPGLVGIAIDHAPGEFPRAVLIAFRCHADAGILQRSAQAHGLGDGVVCVLERAQRAPVSFGAGMDFENRLATWHGHAPEIESTTLIFLNLRAYEGSFQFFNL